MGEEGPEEVLLHDRPAPTPTHRLPRQASSLTRRYADLNARTTRTHAATCTQTHDTHAGHTLLVHLLQHNGRLGRMCARDHILPPPFLAVWWVSVAHMSEAEKHTRKTKGQREIDSQVA